MCRRSTIGADGRLAEELQERDVKGECRLCRQEGGTVSAEQGPGRR